MDEHASIFYCKYAGGYLLCSDSDIEQLDTLKRKSMTKDLFAYAARAYFIKPFKVFDCRNGKLAMRVIYKPKRTMEGRRKDGYVDRLVTMKPAWFTTMRTKFEMTFPHGLTNQLLQMYKAPPVDI